MSMRTWERKMAHEKTKRAGVKKANRQRVINNKIAPSWFAVNWRKIGSVDIRKGEA